MLNFIYMEAFPWIIYAIKSEIRKQLIIRYLRQLCLIQKEKGVNQTNIFRSTILELVPPNPNELDKATFTLHCRALFGT